ncbi:hypothetical protein pb186bvf_009407 [Paramecium bursaria]
MIFVSKQQIQKKRDLSMDYDKHQRKLMQILNRKPEMMWDMGSYNKLRDNQRMIQKKQIIRKWEKVYQENDKILKKINQASSQFKRSSSRSSFKSSQSVQSNRSIEMKQANERRINENKQLHIRLRQVQSTVKRRISETNLRKDLSQSPKIINKSLQVCQIHNVKLLSSNKKYDRNSISPQFDYKLPAINRKYIQRREKNETK